jgi:TorA maturation chaperone TorD
MSAGLPGFGSSRAGMLKDGEMKAILKGRLAIYEFLYMVFYKVPDTVFVGKVKEIEPIVSAIAAEDERFKESAKLFSEYFRSLREPDERVAERLNSEFTRLFLMGHRSITLNESQRIREERTNIILSVSDFFAETGFVKPVSPNLSIDSFPMQLFFLFKLAEQAYRKEEEATFQIHKEFMRKHIMRWVREFVSEVTEFAEAGNGLFYKACASFALAFLETDLAFLNQYLDSDTNLSAKDEFLQERT